jgi:uncharacterized membrane protein YphA (DoxX/SURF4 family)
MNVVLWILQIAVAFLYVAGGAYKTFNPDELMKGLVPFSRQTWVALGVLEMVGGLLIVVPAAMRWMPGLTPAAAAVLAVETAVLAVVYSRYSRAWSVENPMTWAICMFVLVAIVAYGTYLRYAR